MRARAVFSLEYRTFQQVRLGEGQRAQQPRSAVENLAARASAKATRTAVTGGADAAAAAGS